MSVGNPSSLPVFAGAKEAPQEITTETLSIIPISWIHEENRPLFAHEATDEQFDLWARSRMPVDLQQGHLPGDAEDHVWPVERRVTLCNRLW